MKQLFITVFLFFFLAGSVFASAININTADQHTLETLPNIGPTKAQAIIEYRKTHHFKSVEELTNVKGIGDKTLTKLEKQVTVKDE